jgi:hypothetical protein
MTLAAACFRIPKISGFFCQWHAFKQNNWLSDNLYGAIFLVFSNNNKTTLLFRRRRNDKNVFFTFFTLDLV